MVAFRSSVVEFLSLESPSTHARRFVRSQIDKYLGHVRGIGPLPRIFVRFSGAMHRCIQDFENRRPAGLGEPFGAHRRFAHGNSTASLPPARPEDGYRKRAPCPTGSTGKILGTDATSRSTIS